VVEVGVRPLQDVVTEDQAVEVVIKPVLVVMEIHPQHQIQQLQLKVIMEELVLL
tara:strand:- start:163 stop:324 length:162 start_codon:yes stop_codon:yes gene_type:complete